MLAGDWQKMNSGMVSAQNAAALKSAWAALSDFPLEHAGYNAPELILPLLANLGGATLATITQGPDLLLAMPVVARRAFTQSWVTPFTASAVPHVAKGLAESALLAFVSAQSKPLLFKALPSDGAFFKTLQKQSAHYAILEQWERAALRPTGTYEDWLQNNFDQKRRKEFKRLRNRLSEQGSLTTEILTSGTDPQSFVEDLLALEQAGWKGKKGTALAAEAKQAKALQEAAVALHKAGKLRFWSLKFDGKAIASLFAIVEGDQAWLGKIAYDESFAKYSPGVQIILDCTQSFFAEPAIKLIDSSAIPNHPMIDRIWRDRIAFASVFVAPPTISSSRFSFIVAMERKRLQWRERAKTLYYKLRGLKRS